MSAEESKATMRRYLDVFEQGNNLDILDELLAPDYINHTPATPELPTGPEGVKGVVTMFRSAIHSKAPIGLSSLVSRPQDSG